MKNLLRSIKRVFDKIFGTAVNETYWRFRHIISGSKWAESYIGEDSINHAHRQFLADKISVYAPLKSILEIGCASGPNLYILQKKFPEAEFFGIDISRHAIEIGEEWFRKNRIKNIELSEGRADDLSRFSDKSIDIILTDAILIYIGPDKISKVIGEMMRVANKAIILNERHSDASLFSSKNHWIYNYRKLFSEHTDEAKINISKFPKDLWPVGGWKEYGAVIEVNLQ